MLTSVVFGAIAAVAFVGGRLLRRQVAGIAVVGLAVAIMAAGTG